MRMKNCANFSGRRAALVPLPRRRCHRHNQQGPSFAATNASNGAKTLPSTSVDGATAVADKSASTVVITAPDAATAQKSRRCLGQGRLLRRNPATPASRSMPRRARKARKVQTLKVDGVHLCCPKCVKATKAALAAVRESRATPSPKGETSFSRHGRCQRQRLSSLALAEGRFDRKQSGSNRAVRHM